MTDARYPERWLLDRRVTRLSDRAHRAFVVTLAYGVANRTDGVLLAADLRDLPRYVEEEVPALVEAGLVEALPDGTGFVVAVFLETQTTRAELQAGDAARVMAREKKARQRAAARGESAVPKDVPEDRPGGQHRLGQDRPGQALVTGETDQQAPSPSPWPPVTVPGRLQVVDCICFADLPSGEHFDYCPRRASA